MAAAIAFGAGCTTVHGPAAAGPGDPKPDGRSPLVFACSRADAHLDPTPNGVLLGRLLDATRLRTPYSDTARVVEAACSAPPGGTISAPMSAVARSPLGIAGTAGALADGLHVSKGAPKTLAPRTPQRRVAEVVARSFGLDPLSLSPYQGSVPVPSVQGAIYAMDFLLNEPRLLLAHALEDRPSPRECCEFLVWLGGAVSPSAEDAAPRKEFMARAQRDISGSTGGLIFAVAQAIAHIDAEIAVTADWGSAESEAVPPELAGAVTGAILGAENVPGIGWIVVGGLEANTFDMSIVSGVFDPGGDDTYTWRAMKTGNQGIIDLAGNDRYTGSAEHGPAAGIFGLSLIDDHAGDDRYEGQSFACGVGVFGAGVLIDRGGNDRYSCLRWGLGAGAFGAGFIIDEAGSDSYESGSYSQGLGGPLGVGAIIDGAGNDLYRADGVVPSVYDTPGVSYSMSQGVGFGARRLCAGGVGLLVDAEGDDRYEGGEFSQGGGYYFGFGALIDASGSDLYRGDHFSQGFSAHEGAGALIDLEGNDTYWATMSACQGAAWDYGVSLLLDADGDDTYRGGIFSQGSAANQSIAALCDLSGSDRYEATGPSVQGESAENSYHFAATKARSFSVLADTGSGVDWFSSGRALGAVTVTGGPNDPSAPASARLFGLAIDLLRPEAAARLVP